jgi:hypothetical protein
VNYRRDSDGLTPLFHACKPYYLDTEYKTAVLQLLLEAGADFNCINCDDGTVLQMCVRMSCAGGSWYDGAAQLLRDYGALDEPAKA